MKRPRRPQKTKPAKRAAVKAKDFNFDDAKPPKGMAYQWVADPKIDPHREVEWLEAVKAGWKPVPATRHPRFPAKRGRVAFGAMVLMHVSEKRQKELIAADIDRAKAPMKVYRDLFQMDRGSERGFPLVSQNFMVSSNYESVPPDTEAVDIPVMVKLRLDRRFQDAAAALKLTLEQYAQRRITLFLRGDLGGLLLPAPPESGSLWPESIEIHETGLFHITSKV